MVMFKGYRITRTFQDIRVRMITYTHTHTELWRHPLPDGGGSHDVHVPPAGGPSDAQRHGNSGRSRHNTPTIRVYGAVHSKWSLIDGFLVIGMPR